MAKDTETLLKTLLLAIIKAETLEEARDSIKFLCTKEDIAEAEKIANKTKK